MKNLIQVKIESEKDFYNFLQNAVTFKKLQYKSKLYEKFPLNANRVHTIFMIKYFNPKPIEKGAKAFCSYIGFVRLAGSEKISKSFVETERYLEANYINNSLESLSKIINTISMSQTDESPLIDYKENKLTYSLKNVLNKKSRKIIIGHVYPLKSYYNEIIHTLQFIDRFQSKEFKLKVDSSASTMNSMERMVKRIMEENKEIVSEIKKINTVFRRKLEGIAEIIALKGDIEDHLKSRMISQNYSKLRTLKENQERVKNLHIENEILTKKLKNIKQEFQRKQDEQDNMIRSYKYKLNRSNLSSQKAALEKLIQGNNDIKYQIDQAAFKNENTERSNLIELKNKGMTMMSTKSEFLLKAAELFDDKTDTLNKVKIFKEQGVNEAEYLHLKDMKQVKDDIRTELNLLDYEVL